MAITYLSGQRVQGEYGTASPASDWTESGSEYTLTGNQIDFALKRDGNFQTCYYDLGASAVSDTWVLRMHVHFTTNSSSDPYTKVSFWGLSSTDGNFSATQDTAGMVINWSSTSAEKRYYISEGNDTDAEGTSKTVLDTNWTSSDNYYIQIRRTDSTTLKAQLYSDSTYETTVGSEATESSFAGTGLRYVKFAFPDHSSQAEIQNGTIDKIEFYDNVTTATGTPTKLLVGATDEKTTVTDVPVGSQFEETDTRKFYQMGESFIDGSDLKVYIKFDDTEVSPQKFVNKASTVTGNDTLGSGADLTLGGSDTMVYGVTDTPSDVGNGATFTSTSTTSGDWGNFGTSTSQFNFMSSTEGVSGNPKFTMCFWYNLRGNDMVGNTAFMRNNNGEGTDGLEIWFPAADASDLNFMMTGGSGAGRAFNYDDFSDWETGDSDWHFLSMTLDASLGSNQLKIRRNMGTVQNFSKGTGSYTTSANAYQKMMWKHDQNTNTYITPTASFAELSIWARVLTDAELTAIYNSGAGRQLDTGEKVWTERGTAI